MLSVEHFLVYSFRASVITLNICILLGYLWWCKSSWLSSSLEHLKKEFQSCFTSRKIDKIINTTPLSILLWEVGLEVTPPYCEDDYFKKGHEKTRLTYWGNVTSDVNIIVQESGWMYDGSLYTVTRAFVWKVVEAGAIKLGEKRERYHHSVVFNINALPFVLYRGC